MSENTLSGCLAGFLQNPPPVLRKLNLMGTHLQTEDMESLTAAVTAGKLQHLEEMILLDHHLSHAALVQLLHALLKTFGDRKLTFTIIYDYHGITQGIIIIPSEHTLFYNYLQQIEQELRHPDSDTNSDVSDFDTISDYSLSDSD